MHLTPNLPEDTYNEAEYRALCADVQATLLCDPAAAVQTAVSLARARGENWLCEGRKLLGEFGLLPTMPTPMLVNRLA